MLKRQRFTSLYDQYADDIYRYLLVRVRDAQTAEDLTADTFLKAWKHLDSFDFSHPRGWLYVIARNTLSDYWRKYKTELLEEDVELIDDKPTSDVTFDKQLESRRVNLALVCLPKDMRLVVILRFLRGYSARKTGQILGFTESNVRVIQYRALKRLRILLS